jgi:hypothetical protein
MSVQDVIIVSTAMPLNSRFNCVVKQQFICVPVFSILCFISFLFFLFTTFNNYILLILTEVFNRIYFLVNI